MTQAPNPLDALRKPQPLPGQPLGAPGGVVGLGDGGSSLYGATSNGGPISPPQGQPPTSFNPLGQNTTQQTNGQPPPPPPPPPDPKTTQQQTALTQNTTKDTTQQTTQGVDPNQAMAQLMQQFRSRYGRDLTAQEQQTLIQRSGYTGGQVSPEMLANATKLLDQFATPDQALQANQREQLMAILRGETPVTLDPNNPAIAAQRNSFNRTNATNTGRAKLAAAERAAARGTLGTGGFDANLAGIDTAQGDRASQFESNLLSTERQGQIDRLMQGLGLSQQYGATQLQGQLGRGQLSLGLLQALMGDRQAANRLGFDYAQLQNLMNNQSLQAILNGL